MPTGVGTATLDFGAAPGSSIATVTVSGQTGLTSGAHVEAWLQGDSTADHNAYEHLIAPITTRVGDVDTVADSFLIIGSSEHQLTGAFIVHWVWST